MGLNVGPSAHFTHVDARNIRFLHLILGVPPAVSWQPSSGTAHVDGAGNDIRGPAPVQNRAGVLPSRALSGVSRGGPVVVGALS